MKTYLPKWLRQWAAMFLSWHTPEVGGVLHDYANGRWNELHRWDSEEGAGMALSLIEDMLFNCRDNIYVAMIKVEGSTKGYFVVHDSNLNTYLRGFWTGIYDPTEAFQDVAKRCRKIADKMGFRRPDETLGHD